MFDIDLTKPVVGYKAIWTLYRWGRWGWLEDLGIVRSQSEDAFIRFSDDVFSHRLTELQATRLALEVPGAREAASELQLAYLLKSYDEIVGSKQIKERIRVKNEILSRRSIDR